MHKQNWEQGADMKVTRHIRKTCTNRSADTVDFLIND